MKLLDTKPKKIIAIVSTLIGVIAVTVIAIVLMLFPSEQQSQEQNENISNQSLVYNENNVTPSGNESTSTGNATQQPSTSNGNNQPAENNNDNATSNETQIYTGHNLEDYENDMPDIDWSNVTYEEVNGPNTMDRDRLKQTAEDFVRAYYNIGDLPARRTALGGMLDLDYIREQGQNSILYMDYYLDQMVPDTNLVSVNNVQIYNAQSPNATVNVSITLTREIILDDGSQETVNNDLQVRVSLNEDYKVKSIYKQS